MTTIPTLYEPRAWLWWLIALAFFVGGSANMEWGLSPFSPPGMAPTVLALTLFLATPLDHKPTGEDRLMGRTGPRRWWRARTSASWAYAWRRTAKGAVVLLALWVLESVLAALNVGVVREY